jgi:hypothetical protein
MVLAALLALWVLVLSALVFYAFFWIEMLVDAAKHPFAAPKKKYTWLGFIGLTGIGAIAYYYWIKKEFVLSSPPAKEGNESRH